MNTTGHEVGGLETEPTGGGVAAGPGAGTTEDVSSLSVSSTSQRVGAGPGQVTQVAGQVVGGAVALLSRARRVEKPMHPRGYVAPAVLRRHRTSAEPSGAAFLDEAGEDDVLVRVSRSIGLPAPWPDVNGIAIRVSSPGAAGGTADVLLSGTGHGRLTRYLLAPAVRETGGFYGTLLPYGSPTGPVHLGARQRDAATWELLWSRAWAPGSAWTSFAVLELDPSAVAAREDRDIAFDAVRAAPPGLEVLAWHRRLREPSYAAARRSRGDLATPG